MTERYTVMAVDRAGNSWDVLSTDDPREALRVGKAQREGRWADGEGTAYVLDNDSGESCEDRLGELCS